MIHAGFRRSALQALVCFAMARLGAACAAEPVQLTLKDHLFAPNAVEVASDVRFKIEIANQDATPAEFESFDLHAEKIIVGGGKIFVMAGPLKPGIYAFFDDYHPDTAKGTLIAKPTGQ